MITIPQSSYDTCYVAKVGYLATMRARHQREAGLSVQPQVAGQFEEAFN